MSLSPPKTKLARFGLFEADLEQRLLTKGGFRIKLQGQPFQVLALLLERPGEVVTRDEIQQKLWPANTYVEFDDGLNTAIKKLRAALCDSADNPKFVETIPRRGYRFLAPVTFPLSTATNPATESEAAEIILATRERSHVLVEAEPPHTKRYWVSITVVLVLVLGAGFAYWVRHTRELQLGSTQSVQGVPARRRRSVAVLGFRNNTGHPKHAWVSIAISEMLSTELSAGGSVRLISGEDVARIKVELPLGDADTLARDSLSRLRTNLGTDLVVLGSYTVVTERTENRIRLDLRLQDTQTGDTIAEEAVTGRDSELFEMIVTAGSRLRRDLALGETSSQQATEVRASLPANPDAVRLYSEGLARLRVFDGLAARDLFLKTISFEPKFPQAHASLAQAWSMLGNDKKVKEESKNAYELSSNLSRPDRMWIEGAYREANSEWDKAVEIYRTLYEFYSDDLDYGLRLADALRASGKPAEAITILENLHKLPSPDGRDPRIDLSEVRTYIRSGDLKKAQDAVTFSLQEAKSRGARLLLAQALYLQSSTLLNVGEMDKAIGFAEQARQIYHETGDKFGEAAALAEIGTGLWYKSDMSGAVEIYKQCLTMNREIGNRTGAANALNYIGSGLAEQSDLEGARQAFLQALDIYSEVNAQRDVASTLALLAWVQSSGGDLPSARKTYERVLQIDREFHDQQSVGTTLEQMGLVLVAQGHLEEADKMERQALQIAQDSGDKETMASASRNLGNIAVFRGDSDGARKFLDQASSLAKDIGNAGMQAEIEYWRLLERVTEGQLGSAESSLRGLISQFRSTHDIPNEIHSSALLLQVLVDQGQSGEAQKEMDAIQDVAARAQCFEEILQLRIAEGQLKASAGKVAEAARDLGASEAIAAKKGFVLESLEAKLTLGKIRFAVSRSEGSAQLTQLEKDARAKDFGMIVRQAEIARAHPVVR